MTQNQKGFSIVEGLLILTVIGLVAGTGWYVWNSVNATKVNDKPNNQESQKPQVSEISSYKVEEINIEIINLADFDKLPTNVPQDFSDELKKNYVRENERAKEAGDGCTVTYVIEKVSPINIRASEGYREVRAGKAVKDSQLCGGGGFSIWGKLNEKWVEAVAGNAEIYCSKLKSPKIYAEFVSECANEGAELTLIANPNGSIKAAP